MAFADLTGKVALVTGGSRGLGRQDCLTLARQGADVVVTDILIESDPELEKTAQASMSALANVMQQQGAVYTEKTVNEIREMGRKSSAYKVDVTNREQIAEVVAKVKEEYGKIDILINNAATLDHVAQVDKQIDELWDRDVKVNLTGAFNMTKAIFPIMKENNWGRVIFMASVAGTLGGFGQASYSSTKASVIGLGKTVALEGGRYNITANIIAPGVIGTEAFQMGNPEMNERIVKRTVFRKPGEPEDISNTIAFLCSEEARYITGQVLTVAGGIDLFTF
ncbi:MAG: 3-oxoacyl-[acyl-carrier protein] reductase [Chloroflexota bacterium]|jgi:3-oxoacyl-[acyl-carrier protein] reductase|nr:3-oxoacyl-[acyl-carrier protein] reductase [Chloroflexota bacterium]